DSFARFVCSEEKLEMSNIVVVANSVGAVICSTWVHDYAPGIRAMILAAPAFRIKLYVPFAIPGLRLLNAIKNPAFITSYVKSKMLTHDPNSSRSYDNDPMITKEIAVNILLELHDTATRILEDANAIDTPTLILSAGKDWVVKTKPQRVFFERINTPIKKIVYYPDFYHGIFYEKNKSLPIEETRKFIQDCFNTNITNMDYAATNGQVFIQNEYERLKSGPNIFMKFYYSLLRLGIKTLGRLSKGIDIGVENGFDSGLSLDHVYKNKSEGNLLIGKLIDRGYLDAIGWRGIRQRKIHLKECLKQTIIEILKQKKQIKILDIASGPGRYLQEIALEFPQVEILACDNTDSNIQEGKETAENQNIKNIRYLKKDAFDTNSYKNLKFEPDIVVVSGLFELFSENRIVSKALEGLSQIVKSNGYCIYTGQPYHPQLEMIANTLGNRDGISWIMRRRTQLELDQIFAKHGFKKINMIIDRWGIFTVSIAKFNKRKVKAN
ncbi:MAG TPA: class I SAM-dependent methyltransferase family protein, partial [Leptospiraceae bacterium]|nr:class I SAM-dependent methyltransferase family protein [Leptospiraceae bacterium]